MAAQADPDGQLPVVMLMGPTAAGKTRVAVELVQRLPFSVVSVDSAMVYRGMDIGTAKPSAAERQIAPHRLIDICDPAERYSAGRFRDEALQAIREIHAQDRIPLLVGGTGLYFRALQHGLSELPQADAGLRSRLEDEAARHGWASLHARLARTDPATAARIHPNDPQRIQRALEIVELSGRAPSELYARARSGPAPYRYFKVALTVPERSTLAARIAARFQGMLDRGFLDEARRFYQRGDLHAGLPSMRLVGYRQAWQHLEGKTDLARMTELAITATRQLAKRQITWLRGETGLRSFSGEAPEAADNMLKYLQQEAHFRVDT